ncbi:MAG: hypothetical protein PUG85_08170, partial [Oscillospiraceae bacterium]|nr:hypothetical protein [Oscillospiraceae bacterium]
MKKVTKLVSFCAAVAMAVTAIPASSLMLAKAASNLYDGKPTITAGTTTAIAEGDLILSPIIYNGGDFITEGLSIAYKTGDHANPATAELMSNWTYEGCESSSEFNDLGTWKVNKNEMIFANLTNGTSKINSGVLDDEGMIPLELYFTLPDDDTIRKIAAKYAMPLQEDTDGSSYYFFPLELDEEKINSEGGNALMWVTENNTVVDMNVDNTSEGGIKVKLSSPTTTTTTTTTTDISTTTTTTTTAVTTTTTTASTTTTTSGTTTTIGNEPTVKVGQQFVEADEEWATAIKPEIYNAPETWGLSLAFKTGAKADPATADLMSKWTYEGYESSSEFNVLGSWRVNDTEMIWASLSNGTTKIEEGTLTDGMSPLELYYTIPDAVTIRNIATKYGMEEKTRTVDGMEQK